MNLFPFLLESPSPFSSPASGGRSGWRVKRRSTSRLELLTALVDDRGGRLQVNATVPGG